MTSNKHKIQLTPEEKKARLANKKINNTLVLWTIVLCIAVVTLFGINLFKIVLKKQATSGGNTLQTETIKGYSNEYYTIGNNPTKLQKEYFEELTEVVYSRDKYTEENRFATAELVTKSFIADFFTWTNKDGNYEVGGLQYIYADKYVMFQEEARYNFYSDLDLYISQYGRENLLEVDSVTTHDTRYGGDFDVNGKTYLSYYVDAEWTYKDSKSINVDDFQNKARFRLVDNTESGRYEIVEIIER